MNCLCLDQRFIHYRVRQRMCLTAFWCFLGPLVVGSIRQATGDFRLAFLSVLAFVVIGFLLLTRVDIAKGVRECIAVTSGQSGSLPDAKLLIKQPEGAYDFTEIELSINPSNRRTSTHVEEVSSAELSAELSSAPDRFLE